jgi:hypothetical protein
VKNFLKATIEILTSDKFGQAAFNFFIVASGVLSIALFAKIIIRF